jgi:cytoskeletal protein RodZ
VQDTLVYADEYKRKREKRRVGLLALALVAAVVFSVGIWAIWWMHPTLEVVGNSQQAQNASPAKPMVAGGDSHQDKQSEIPRIETVMIVLPPR